jgi:hypothetical protein
MAHDGTATRRCPNVWFPTVQLTPVLGRLKQFGAFSVGSAWISNHRSLPQVEDGTATRRRRVSGSAVLTHLIMEISGSTGPDASC